MSQFGPNFDRAARSHDARVPDEYWAVEIDLDACVPCFCGASAAVSGPRTPNVRLICSNRRCGRTTTPGAPLANAIEEWNRSVKEDSCVNHQWLTVNGRPGAVKCRFCDAEKNLGSAQA